MEFRRYHCTFAAGTAAQRRRSQGSPETVTSQLCRPDEDVWHYQPGDQTSMNNHPLSNKDKYLNQSFAPKSTRPWTIEDRVGGNIYWLICNGTRTKVHGRHLLRASAIQNELPPGAQDELPPAAQDKLPPASPDELLPAP